jgi:beta-galactosidase
MPSHLTRQQLLLEQGWLFHLGDLPSPVPNTHIAAYMANKAGWSRGAARTNFDDSDWRVLDLPHDWSVEGEFNPDNHLDSGYLPRGVAWYRRHFSLDESDRGKHLALQFDGVATHCTVYVNGHLLHRNFSGYTPFTIDISDMATFGEQLNVIAVRVDATYMEGWWYEGAGIYRHVWLIKTGKVHITPFGVFIHSRPADALSPSPGTPREGRGEGDFERRTVPEIPNHPHPNPLPGPRARGPEAERVREVIAQWDTTVELTLQNDSFDEAKCTVETELIDPSGKPIAKVAVAANVAPRSTMTTSHTVPVQSPALWSPASPQLYRAHTVVRVAQEISDDVANTFGFRTIRFDADHGFFINDEPLKLKGTCNHQDHAGVGVAVPDSIQRFRIQRLLDMGSNAYRCAHNPPAAELLDASDELGMLVMDETRNFGSSPEHLEQLRTMLLRDRNHPSIILWSICNEEAIQGTAVGGNIARTMQQLVKQLDPTRAVTAAVSGGILNDGAIGDVVEVMGINYQLPAHDQYHAKRPRVPLLAAETHSTLATRGTYETKAEQHAFAADDSQAAPWGATARQTWRFVSTRPYIAGLFAWTGFDYRGEPTPHTWPCVSSFFGILDTCGFAKDSFYLHKAFFTAEPFAHISPHWNWPGSEGRTVRVRVYTNAESAELFLNGQSLGRKPADPIEMVSWEVAYQPGRLEATAFRRDAIVAKDFIKTTGPASEIGIEVDPSFNARVVPADGEFALPITLFALDDRGRRVPTANDLVNISLEGPAKLLGVGNGDPTCHEPNKSDSRSLFHGLAQAIVQTTRTAGDIRITAASPGLKPGVLTLASLPAQARPFVAPQQVRRFISDWRMSPVTPDRPDISQRATDQDMNSWERVDPSQHQQPSWPSGGGYTIYRATFAPPRSLQSRGGRIVFHEVRGDVELYLNDVAVIPVVRAADGVLEVELKQTAAKVTLALLVCAKSAPAGILQPVEILELELKAH